MSAEVFFLGCTIRTRAENGVASFVRNAIVTFVVNAKQCAIVATTRF